MRLWEDEMNRVVSAAAASVTLVAAVAVRNDFGCTKPERDCGVNAGRSTVVYSPLLQRWQTPSAAVRRLQPGWRVDRSSENTRWRACRGAHPRTRRTGDGHRRHLVSGRGSEI